MLPLSTRDFLVRRRTYSWERRYKPICCWQPFQSVAIQPPLMCRHRQWHHRSLTDRARNHFWEPPRRTPCGLRGSAGPETNQTTRWTTRAPLAKATKNQGWQWSTVKGRSENQKSTSRASDRNRYLSHANAEKFLLLLDISKRCQRAPGTPSPSVSTFRTAARSHVWGVICAQ